MGLTPTRRCDRCAAAGQRGTAERTFAPHWDAGYRMCSPCLKAVEYLLAETGTLPRPDGAGGFTFPEHPAHTGALDFLWCPHKDGLAAQIAAASAAPCPPQRLVGLHADTETFPSSGERTEPHSAPPDLDPAVRP